MGDVGLSVGDPKRQAPSGWSWVPLTSVARMESGHTPSRGRPDYWGGEIPWIGIRDAKRFHGSEITETIETTNELGIANSSARILPKDTVCLSRTASVGYVVKMGRDMATSQDFANWVCSDRLDPDFLVHLLLAESRAFSRFSSGSVHQTIYYPELKAFHICLPPLEEQQRIVAILDEAFAGLDRARANAEANLKSARELFEVIKADALGQDGADCEIVTLAEVSEIASSLVDPRQPRFGQMPHLGAGNMVSGSDELFDVKTAAEEKLISGKYLFDENAVLYSKIRPYLRKAARPEFGGLCSADVYPLTPKAGRLDRHFLFHLLLSREFTEYAIAGSDRAGMPKVNRDHLFAYRFHLPPIDAQRRIAALIDDAHIACQSATRLVNGKVADIADLRQSLLQKAFAGELTLPKPHHVLLPANDDMPLSAQILALGYSRHQSALRERTYGHVKAQKLLHLAETVCGYDLGRVPIKDAAGPNDMRHMGRVEEWAKANQVFEFRRRPFGGYTFVPLEGFSQAVRGLQSEPDNRLSRLVKIIGLLAPMDSEGAEVLATVHAAWSNLIKDGAAITDELIVTAAREDWHPEKMKIARSKFFDAIRTIKAASIEPDGTAQYVGTRQGKLL